MNDDTPIPVTRPTLPPLEAYLPYLEQIWQSRQLTNNGPFHQQLEAELAAYLGVPFVSLYANGTLALIAALKVLDLDGEVITTPFTFAATAHAIVWAGLKPVFVDIDSQTCNLDPQQVADAITPQTAAILPVHCYGNPCDVDAFRDLGHRHGLPVVYDAAHAFGVRYRGESLLVHGNLSVLSFHATKVFNTVEGGAVVCHDADIKARLDRFRNFGFASPGVSVDLGLNAKMNELQAALGLVQLPHVAAAIARRRQVDATYRQLLDADSIVVPLRIPPGADSNHAYFPVLVRRDAGVSCDDVMLRLKRHNVFARRYFHPLAPGCDPKRVPNARSVAEQVLCLPMHDALTADDLERIGRILR